jgi:hypothetical protein
MQSATSVCRSCCRSAPDDDFAAELFTLLQKMPSLLDELQQQVTGRGWMERRKRTLIGLLRRARAGAARELYLNEVVAGAEQQET